MYTQLLNVIINYTFSSNLCIRCIHLLRHSCQTTIRAPVHIITGSAGCQEGRDQFKNNPSRWSAFRSQDYGYTKFMAFNNTHIQMEQVSVDLEGQVIDSFWLIKTKLRFYETSP